VTDHPVPFASTRQASGPVVGSPFIAARATEAVSNVDMPTLSRL
jgi:hypothetical protein